MPYRGTLANHSPLRYHGTEDLAQGTKITRRSPLFTEHPLGPARLTGGLGCRTGSAGGVAGTGDAGGAHEAGRGHGGRGLGGRGLRGGRGLGGRGLRDGRGLGGRGLRGTR